MMMHIRNLILIIFFHYSISWPIVVGSNTAVSIQARTTFPAADADNEMRGFAAFSNGITLTNSSTRCLYNSFFPLGGPITLNGGLLNLNKDLSITGTNTFLSNACQFNGNLHALSLPEQVATFTTTGAITIGNADLMLNSNVTLNAQMTFTNVCTVEGNGKTLNVTNGNLAVGSGSSVLLKNITILNGSGNRVFCIDNTGTFSLENVTWILDANYSFTQGILEFFDDVKITGINKIFSYSSTKTSIIHSNSTLYFDTTMTFSYASNTNSLLSFIDNTSYLYLYETTLFTTSVGLQLTKGSLVIDGICPVINNGINSAGGISMGDGTNAYNNLTVQVLAESGFNVQTGFLVYQNV